MTASPQREPPYHTASCSRCEMLPVSTPCEQLPRDDATTQVCLLTPPGRSALAVVGVRGPAALPAVATSFAPRGSRPLADRPDRVVVFGRWGGEGGEELVVVRRADDDLEVHCHGGSAAAAAIIHDLVASGCRQVARDTWERTATEAQCDGAGGHRTLIAAEARLALSRARGPQATRMLAHQLSGTLADAWDELLAASPEQRQHLADRLLCWQHLGLRLAEPWRVVVSGPPNAGKSSLVNALAGFARSIVSPTPGTTRDVLETRLVLEGWDVVLIDTAGLRLDTDDAIEQAGIASARAAAAEADLVLTVSAADQPAVPPASAPPTAPPHLTVVTKSDLLPASVPPPPNALLTSTFTGEGIEDLAGAIIHRLIPKVPGPGQAVPFTPRQVQLLQAYRQ